MNTEFINTIYEKNNTEKGLNELFSSMESIEKYYHLMIEEKNITNWSTVFSHVAKDNPKKIAIIESDNDTEYTYWELHLASEKISKFIIQNIDSYMIGLNYHNSFLYIACLLGINKANRLAILFNNREPRIRQEELAKNNNIKVILGNKIEGCLNFKIDEILDIDLPITKQIHNQKNLFKVKSLDEPAFVIFTSGTTGKSKGALFSHRRMIGAGIAWSLRTAMTSADNCYIPLPLYHGNGLAVALSSVFFVGATATIRIKYSTSQFFSDIEKFNTTHMCYIGELWRYILNHYKEKKETSLKVIFGNGLTKELWREVINRFNIKHVVEHFGATEMPAGALTNWYNIAGYCGYLPIKYPNSKNIILVDELYNETQIEGEALFLIPDGKYRGYLDKKLDESKLIRNIKSKGDLWWRSGDLLRINENGFFTFIERLGDTYRYKGENISCVDVEDAIRKCGKFKEAVVYGIQIPYVEGKVGMASLVIKSLDLEMFYKKIQLYLPNYSLPRFIKIEKENHPTTSTLKIQKTKLALSGIEEYDLKEIYILFNHAYTKVDKKLYTLIMNGKIDL